MDARALRLYEALASHGVTVHLVRPSGNHPDEFHVVLEANLGQSGQAESILRFSTPGVRSVAVSTAAPAFLTVLVEQP